VNASRTSSLPAAGEFVGPGDGVPDGSAVGDGLGLDTTVGKADGEGVEVA
jgi:hypothetical protein